MLNQQAFIVTLTLRRRLRAAIGCLLVVPPLQLASAQPATAAVGLLPASIIGAQSQPNLGFLTHRPTTVSHVATTGNDANPGTADRPWRTIGKAVSALQPGQGVVVHGGNYS